jgi:septum formation protein
MDSQVERLILASASPRRQQLLGQMGYAFTVEPAHIDEEAVRAASPAALARRLALLKAREVAGRQTQPALVIGADTLVISKGRVLGKPSDREEAHAMLKRLSGSWHRVITGLALVEAPSGRSMTAHETTAVRFSDMTDQEILDYLDTGDSMDKAGAYGIQGRAGMYIPRIRGCYFNVMGLPLHRLYRMLAQMGYRDIRQG